MTDTVPDKAADVIKWIDDAEGTEQQRRAAKALAAENERSGGPRSTVTDHIDGLTPERPQPGVGRTPPAPDRAGVPGH